MDLRGDNQDLHNTLGIPSTMKLVPLDLKEWADQMSLKNIKISIDNVNLFEKFTFNQRQLKQLNLETV